MTGAVAVYHTRLYSGQIYAAGLVKEKVFYE